VRVEYGATSTTNVGLYYYYHGNLTLKINSNLPIGAASDEDEHFRACTHKIAF
jgi:hypothetical protein